MQIARKLLVSAALLGSSIGGVAIYAQPADTPAEPAATPTEDPSATPTEDSASAAESAPAAADTGETTATVNPEAQLPPEEMKTRASEAATQADGDRKRVDELQAVARKKQDVIKLNCINDKMLQLKQLLNILDDGLARLTAAISTGDDAERYHRYTVVTVSAEKIHTLREEAEACIGEEISYLGPLDIEVEAPDLDDPTDTDPFGDDVIEPPGYASPFF